MTVQVPANDHVCRHCLPTHIDEGVVSAAAFMRRPSEQGLSVNWLEFLNEPNLDRQLKQIRKVYKNKNMRLTSDSRIAVLNVGDTLTFVETYSKDNRRLTVNQGPSNPKDPSHCVIHGMDVEEVDIAQLIALTVLSDHPSL